MELRDHRRGLPGFLAYCLLCAEHHPEDCHRMLIAQYLPSVA
jgi:hypothetical protein